MLSPTGNLPRGLARPANRRRRIQRLPPAGTSCAVEEQSATVGTCHASSHKSGKREKSRFLNTFSDGRNFFEGSPPPVGQVSNLPVMTALEIRGDQFWLRTGRLETCPTGAGSAIGKNTPAFSSVALVDE